MKFLKIIRSYLRGSAFSALVLMIVMTFSIFSGVMTFAKIQDISFDYRTLSSAKLKNAYYLSNYIAPEAFEGSSYSDFFDAVYENADNIKSIPGVKRVYVIKNVSPVLYNGSRVPMIIYDGELADAFPILKNEGLFFSDEENGCVLSGVIFQSIKKGDAASFSFISPNGESKNETFFCSGKLKYPNKYLSFHGGGTKPGAEMLLSSGNAVIVKSTEKTEKMLSSVSSITPSVNFIVCLEDGIGEAVKNKILSDIEENGRIFSLEELSENTRLILEKELKESLPLPFFMLVSATVAYFSCTVLLFKKKEKELAVNYLCGASRSLCRAVSAAAGLLLSLIPVLINIFAVAGLNTLRELGKIDFSGYMADGKCFLIMFAYFVMTAAISFGVSAFSMSRHSPLVYLKGVSQ